MYRQFFEEYDPKGKLTFDNVSFRKGAEFTLDFGIYIDYGNKVVQSFKDVDLYFSDNRRIYFHCGVDRGDYKRQNIFNPFAGYGHFYTNVPGYGTVLVILPISADFVVRIAHIHLSQEILEMIKDHEIIPANAFLGSISSEGTGTGAHSHTEIVSIYETSEICDYIIEKKSKTNYDYICELKRSDIPESILYDIDDYCRPRNIQFFNKFACQRNDGMRCKETQTRLVTYYNSRELFKM